MDEISRARSALQSIDAGCPREHWVRAGMAAKAAGLTFDDFLAWSQCGANYSGERDCKSAWQSFTESGGVSAATLFAMAFAAGWKDPAKRLQAANGGRANLPSPSSRKAPVMALNAADSAKVSEVWERCIPASPEQPYIARKGGLTDGLRVYPQEARQLVIRGNDVRGWLAIPCRELDGNLKTIQFVPPQGDKLNLPGASFGEGCFVVGELTHPSQIFVVEGIAQAWAVNAVSEAPAVVCFGSGRMRTVSTALRGRYPSASVILVPDRGKEALAAEISGELTCQWVELPPDTPENFDANDLALLEGGVESLAELLAKPKSPEPPPLPLSVAFAEELNDKFEPPDELVEGVLTVGAGSVLYGDSNSGKTFFAIDMAAAVARGTPWMGKQTEQGMVIYLAAESPASVQSRLQAYQRHYGVKVPNFAIVQNPIDLFDGEADTEAVIQLVRQLERQRQQKARLIVGDTLARLSAGANENSGQDMGLVVRRFDRIRLECVAHFLLVHHSGKNAANGARGWSGIKAAIDTEIEVTDSPSGRCAEITKQRDLATKGERIGFRLETVILGLTKWKSLATSCIVLPADAPAKSVGKRISEMGGAILEMLRSRGAGLKKAEVVKHFAGRYDKSSVYRELKRLVEGGQVQDCIGIVSATKGEGAKGAN